MSEQVYAGLTSQSIDVFLGNSASSVGAGLTGLVYNTASLTCYYRKGATGTPTAITLATQTVGGAWTSGGFVAVDGTNMPGVYRFDIPNAVVDTEGFVTLYFQGAANLVPTALRIDCRAARATDTAGAALATATAVAAIPAAVRDVSNATPAAGSLGEVVNQIKAFFAGITSLAQWLGLIAGKQTGNTTARTELRATGAGSGTFDETTDSTQAIADAIPTAAANFAAVLTTQLTESYAADGTAPTLAQAIFLIQQSLHEFAISGTTRTVKKLDGSTTAATFTLDDASAPTSTTRAT